MIHCLSIPNPFFEGRNSVYLLRADPLTLIDTGVATDKSYQHLESGLQELGVSVKDIRRVILTHKHIDHIGNAWRVQRESGAEIFVHELECKSLTNVDPTGSRFKAMVEARMADWGVPRETVPSDEANSMPLWKLEPAVVQPLQDGQQLTIGDQTLEVIHTPGHTMGSVCLQLGGNLFSGDHVLQKISPNVGGGDMRSDGMLGRFLQSLERVHQLGDVHVFPGHGEPFGGLPARCSTLIDHHDQRLELTLDAIRNGATTVFDVATALFGELRDFHIVLGCAEANAHLELLIERRQIAPDFSLQ